MSGLKRRIALAAAAGVIGVTGAIGVAGVAHADGGSYTVRETTCYGNNCYTTWTTYHADGSVTMFTRQTEYQL